MLLLIDNYDSFTYNLYQYLAELGAEVVTHRNDKITLDEIEDLAPEGIVISPGPCTPREAGISNDVIRRFGKTVPTLGVCLGHQCVGYVYGAVVDQAGEIRHGKTSMVHHNGAGVLAGPAQSLRGDTLPFAGGLSGHRARLPGNHRPDRKRADHGPAAQRAPGGRSTIPPRVHHDPRRQATAAELPGPGRQVQPWGPRAVAARWRNQPSNRE